MGEKTDLRVVKTKKAIKETFLQMRKTTPLEKIKVREICKVALINKSTFYAHYADVFDLSDQLENEMLIEFLDKFTAKDCLFSDPICFLSEMPKVFDANMDMLYPLFKDRLDIAFQKIQKLLKDYYTDETMNETDYIRLVFVLGGALHTVQELKFEKKYDDMMLAQTIASLIEKI